MPLYYTLSGIFFKSYGSFGNFLTKKTDKLLIPLIAWYLISYGVYYLRVLAIGEPEHIFNILDIFTAPDFYNGVLWFLLSLFWCNLLYYAIDKVAKGEMAKLTCVVAIAALGGLWGYLDLRNFLYIGTSLTCLPYFYFGRKIFQYNVISREKSVKKDLLIGLLCCVAFVACIYIPEEPPRLIFYLNLMESGNMIHMYISGFSLVLLVLLVCKYLKKIPYVSYLGRYSIIVLVTHRLLQNIFTRSIEHVTGLSVDSTSAHLLLFFLIVALMALIIPFCKRYLPYICAQVPVLENRYKRELSQA